MHLSSVVPNQLRQSLEPGDQPKNSGTAELKKHEFHGMFMTGSWDLTTKKCDFMRFHLDFGDWQLGVIDLIRFNQQQC